MVHLQLEWEKVRFVTDSQATDLRIASFSRYYTDPEKTRCVVSYTHVVVYEHRRRRILVKTDENQVHEVSVS